MTFLNCSGACNSNEEIHDKGSRKILSGESLLRRCRSEYQNGENRPCHGRRSALYVKSLMGLNERRNGDPVRPAEAGRQQHVTCRRAAVHKSYSMPQVNRLSLKRGGSNDCDEEPQEKRQLYVEQSVEVRCRPRRGLR